MLCRKPAADGVRAVDVPRPPDDDAAGAAREGADRTAAEERRRLPRLRPRRRVQGV